MSEFHGRRRGAGDWEWEPRNGKAAALRPYSAPLFIGALLALLMLVYVVAGGSWSFDSVSPNDCQAAEQADRGETRGDPKPDTGCGDPCLSSAGGVSAETFDCDPCPNSAGEVSAQNPDCDPCPDPAGGVSAETFDCDPCPDVGAQNDTPPECETPTPAPSETCDGDYSVSLFDPTVPDGRDVYTYLVEGCGEPEIRFVKFSGCWTKNEIDYVELDPAGAGTAEILDDGAVRVNDLADEDLPLKVIIHFKDTLTSRDSGTWVWLWTGPADSDGMTFIVGGPLC